MVSARIWVFFGSWSYFSIRGYLARVTSWKQDSGFRLVGPGWLCAAVARDGGVVGDRLAEPGRAQAEKALPCHKTHDLVDFEKPRFFCKTRGEFGRVWHVLRVFRIFLFLAEKKRRT